MTRDESLSGLRSSHRSGCVPCGIAVRKRGVCPGLMPCALCQRSSQRSGRVETVCEELLEVRVGQIPPPGRGVAL